ncbi:MAG: hypothetical protein A2015_03135 [Spirochaetes bacterium GWF1_31_7]|nr:MAG: hypothetical protein A2Y30_16595 [Spirochaetes bacterium GWE1_32_154]OHD50962.1 MAG: hypothetical protein A2015_03135 [Spirochaetes bacterium GWF1_31_7]OHD51119.1 MAG: hypothetical protein A2Y29_10965 [Spirochaetes bacterium GWE2_31_10]HBD95574.1 hypothetical protein [Spirochaetia bacterium]HBI37264.1 hypothetical protein [Spirochaetia bacterium]
MKKRILLTFVLLLSIGVFAKYAFNAIRTNNTEVELTLQGNFSIEQYNSIMVKKISSRNNLTNLIFSENKWSLYRGKGMISSIIISTSDKSIDIQSCSIKLSEKEFSFDKTYLDNNKSEDNGFIIITLKDFYYKQSSLFFFKDIINWAGDFHLLSYLLFSGLFFMVFTVFILFFIINPRQLDFILISLSKSKNINILNTIISSKYFQIVFSLLLFLICLIYGIFKASKGIDFTDEGFYISSALRLIKGDLPIKDDSFSIVSMFAVFISMIFRVFPNISLYGFKIIGMTLQFSSLSVLFISFRKKINIAQMIFLTLAMFLFNNYAGRLVPSYNLLSSNFIILSVAFWLIARSSLRLFSKTIFSIFGGIAFTIACYSYPTAGIFILTWLINSLLTLIFSKEKKNCIPDIILLTTFALFSLLGILLMYGYGLFDYFFEFLKLSRDHNSLASMGLGKLLSILIINFPQLSEISFFTISVMIFLSLISLKNRKFTSLAVIVFFVLLSTNLVFFRGQNTNLLILFYTIIAAVFILINSKELFKNYNSDLKILYSSIISGSILLIYLFSISTHYFNYASSYTAGVQGIPVLFVLTMVILIQYLESEFRNSKYAFPSSAFISLTLFIVLISGYIYNYNTVYRDQPMNKLTVPFTHKKLSGIFSSEERVKGLEELLKYTDQRIKKDDFLLTYTNSPLLYFLTDTRPAYNFTWTFGVYPFSQVGYYTDLMIKKNRIPTYCIIESVEIDYPSWENSPKHIVPENPLTTYIQENYYPEKYIFPYEVWKRKD